MTTDSRHLEPTEITEAETDATEILSRYRRLAMPALREAVEKLHPWPARMAAFTFGWADRDGNPHRACADAGGKGLRPALALMSARAVGASAESAVAGAVAVELVHAFSLVHDDIMDGDERRRNRETAWKAYGIGPAVLAGDALLALAMATLAEVPGGATAVGQLSRTLVDLVHGQAEDIAFESRPWTGPRAVTTEQYLAMAAAKTGSLLGCAAAVGTLLGGGSPTRAAAMRQLGQHLGLAFQIADDLLGIWGDPAITGKAVGNDLRRGKKTLPVLAALETESAAARCLAGLLTAPDLDAADLRLAADLIERSGGRALARAEAHRQLERALRILGTLEVAEPVAGELAGLARRLVDRSH